MTKIGLLDIAVEVEEEDMEEMAVLLILVLEAAEEDMEEMVVILKDQVVIHLDILEMLEVEEDTEKELMAELEFIEKEVAVEVVDILLKEAIQ